jgi:hypothetical protein
LSRRHAFTALAALLIAVAVWALSTDGASESRTGVSRTPATAAGTRGGTDRQVEKTPTPRAAVPETGPRDAGWPASAPPTVDAGAAAGPTRVLAGWVVDSSGEPVTDAVVIVSAPGHRPLSALSDETGGFRIATAPREALRVTADGGELGATALVVSEGGDETTLQLTLEAAAWVVVLVDPSVPRAKDAPAPHVELHTTDASLNTPFSFEAPSTEAPEGTTPFSERLPVARGAPGERLRVVAGVNHSVELFGVDPPVGYYRCGQVRAEAGAEIVVVCSKERREAVVRGRVVSSEGAPIAGLEVGYEPWSVASLMALDDSWTRARSGVDGRFELKVSVGSAEIGAFETTPTDGWARLSRRNVSVVAGATTDLGDVFVMARAEVPRGWMDEPFGGIGGLVILSDRGISLLDVEPDCPLAAAGVEGGDVITHIDGLDAGTMHMSEALKRLRGDVGTRLVVTVRNPLGESVALDLVRGVIRPGRENWPELDRGAETERVEIEFEPFEIGGEPPPEGTD